MDHNYNRLGRGGRVFSNDLVCDTGNFFGCTVRTFQRLFRRMGSDKRHLVSRDWLVRSGMVRDSEYFWKCRKLVRINLSVSMERGSKCLFKLGIILFWLVGYYPKHIFKSGNVYRERDRRRGKIRDQWRNIYDSKHGKFRDQNYQWSN